MGRVVLYYGEIGLRFIDIIYLYLIIVYVCKEVFKGENRVIYRNGFRWGI